MLPKHHNPPLFTATLLLPVLALLLLPACDAQLPARCLENPVVSPCGGSPYQFYYNQTKARCQANPNSRECSATQNKFSSLADCQSVCEYDRCDLALDEGDTGCTGEANVTKYYYDRDTNQCKTFTYSSCAGNDNRFDTLSDCTTACPNICQLPQDQGTCTANIARYYFDSASGQCKHFYYFGCAGNKNNFQTISECQQKCLGRDDSGSVTTTVAPNIDDDCLQERERGPCYGYYKRYYYDQDEGRCRRFIYGGCRGNRNNFRSLSHCERRCTPRSEPTVPSFCLLDSQEGTCNSHRTRYYYNATSERCESFSYSGCGGNANNFRSYYRCKNACRERRLPDRSVCSLERERGPCRRYRRRYYYDQDRGQCRRFIYGGCEGNGNNFGSLSSCQYRCEYLNRDVCSLDREPGPCHGYYRSYYYDEESGRCRSFIYGGCDGNGNRFRTRRQCQLRCDTRYFGRYPPYDDYYPRPRPRPYPGDYDDDNDEPQQDDSNACILVKDEGPCRARLERWYFDRSSGECRRFFYGGCQGNANNFRSKAACERRCCPDLLPSTTVQPNPTEPEDVCEQPRRRGPCRAAFIRFYYDSDSGRCRSFIYGGCEGNQNNFRTLRACRRMCGRRPPPPTTTTTEVVTTPAPNPTQPDPESSQGCSESSESSEDCSDKSGPKSRRCYQPEECGPCDGILMRYYYEPLVNDCIVFIYGGCGGNGNNFKSYSDCKRKCL